MVIDLARINARQKTKLLEEKEVCKRPDHWPFS